MSKITKNISLTVNPSPLPDVYFTVSPDALPLSSNSGAVMTWSVKKAASVTINATTVAFDGQANLSFAVRQNTQFTLVATGPGGVVTQVRTVQFLEDAAIFHKLPDYLQFTINKANKNVLTTIPNFAKFYTHRAMFDGFWDQAEVWHAGTVPDESSVVYIPFGVKVGLRGGAHACKSLGIFGTLEWEPNANITLVLVNAIVMPEGRYVDGTVGNPVPADKLHELIFRDVPFSNLGNVGDSYGKGVIYAVQKNCRWDWTLEKAVPL